MIQSIIFDFDGVVLDSMPVKDRGFELLFAEFDEVSVKKLLAFHRENGGISRFVKIRHMFENILGQSITDEGVSEYAERYSKLMLAELTSPKYIIDETLDFIKEYSGRVPMHVASGTEQNELRYICQCQGLTQFFGSIYGSPAPKDRLVADIIAENCYDPAKVVMIGDSTADHDAARASGLIFCGYNGERLRKISDFYIDDYGSFAERFLG
ncbi:HAD family hydrolase [Seleniivibrio woodruffii]|uniref:HAD family hydrolase n=1 Tax=Seleniivibrio woodruffii TaxID=1078050 RepID=UPI00240937C0|nr:HAD hydrolase-like protein [Seleniivibrio woodruffii]